jgi:hypothetical protein
MCGSSAAGRGTDSNTGQRSPSTPPRKFKGRARRSRDSHCKRKTHCNIARYSEPPRVRVLLCASLERRDSTKRALSTPAPRHNEGYERDSRNRGAHPACISYGDEDRRNHAPNAIRKIPAPLAIAWNTPTLGSTARGGTTQRRFRRYNTECKLGKFAGQPAVDN